MRRREFITLLGGAAAIWPLAAGAQQSDRVRRIGVLIALAESDPEAQTRAAAFRDGLQKLGWTEGHNIRIDYRWAADADHLQTYAAELVGLTPDVILGSSSATLAALKRATGTIPIVFAQVADPVRQRLCRKSGAAGRQYHRLRDDRGCDRHKVVRITEGVGAARHSRGGHLQSGEPHWAVYVREIEAKAPSFGVQLSAVRVHNTEEIERAVDALAREPNGGLIVVASPFTGVHRDLIIALAARHHLPAVYQFRFFAMSGGLASYGIDNIDLYRRTASYVDLILRGANPSDLPVQFPAKFELVINLKTAKALGLDRPSRCSPAPTR